MDAAIDHFKTQTLVNTMRKVIVDPGVGGHFGAALGAGPVFRGGEQLFAEATAAMAFDEVPAFEVADGMAHIAAVGMGAQSDLEKSDKGSIGRFGHQDYGGKGADGRAGEGRSDFFGVMFGGIFGPERVEQARERFAVGGTRGADANFGHGEHFNLYLRARIGTRMVGRSTDESR